MNKLFLIVLWTFSLVPQLIPATFQQWQQEVFTPAELGDPAISGADADPDGKGIPNLLRYALGLNLWAAGPHHLPGIWNGRLHWRENAAATDLLLLWQSSDNLTDWVTHNSLLDAQSQSFGSWRQRSALLPESGSASEEKAFFRLRALLVADPSAPLLHPPDHLSAELRMQLMDDEGTIRQQPWDLLLRWTDASDAELGYEVERKVGFTSPNWR